ncbi:type VI secretion system tube protein Hcp [Parasulfitobacter algicola]|uniref:Type VI secretion system tube protein Hcp n=1 Tax=Parasulfitobacter algicola TaxID=2614809 RepID=A0ABX2IRM2_9RHOB|nr:type VI secretion system tube protein Hcp [Sulfitobacter algicola]NSX53740.1 type VI secretion system tube protein Hcp [Sulfitobacter algicola]
MPIYLQIDGIPGNVTEEGYENWIKLDTCCGGVHRLLKSPAGDVANRDGGTVTINPITCSKGHCSASAKLEKEGWIGHQGRPAKIHFVTNGNPNLVTKEVELKDVLVEYYNYDSSDGNVAQENFQLNFTEISVTAHTYDKNNSVKDTSRYWFSLVTNKGG